MCFLRYEKTRMSSCMCPSLGISRCEDSIDASTLILTLPNSTIHLKTPIKEWKYAASSSPISGVMSVLGRYPLVIRVTDLAARPSPIFLRYSVTLLTAASTYFFELKAQHFWPFSSSTSRSLPPRYWVGGPIEDYFKLRYSPISIRSTFSPRLLMTRHSSVYNNMYS